MRARRTFLRSVGHAAAGLRRTGARQPNFRIQLLLGAVALTLACWLRAPITPVLLATGLVLTAELLNTALEELVDLVSPEHHELAGAAKDAGAAAVLVASIAALLVGLIVLGPPLASKLAAA